MRSISEIRRDMEYPSPEVKTRCMNEVARYLRDAYECGVYSKALDKLSGCDYYFRIDPDELMELLTNRYDCGELCEKAVQLRESYAAKIDLPVEKIDKIDAGFIHKFVCEQVTGRILDLENINCQYIDDFVQGIEELKIPGILYPLIWFTRNRDKKVFLYIYEKYVLPAYINLSESNAIDRYDALGEVLCGYIEELIIYVVGTGDGVYVTSIQKNSTWDDVMMKFKKTGEFDCIRRAREKLKFSNGIGTLLYALNKKYKHWLKSKYKTYRSDFYPMFAALIAFALLGEKRDREAVEFMIDNYADISEDNYQSDYSLIILFQTILLADNYEYMNILYAYLLKEKLSYKRAYTEIYDLIIKA